MNFIVNPCEISGTISAPASKSFFQRAVAITMAGNIPCLISNFSSSADANIAIEIAQNLGADIIISNSEVQITPNRKNSKEHIINCGESAFCARVFSVLSGLISERYTITGAGSLMRRPFDMVEQTLRQLGMKVTSQNGFLPLEVTGKMKSGEIQTDGSVSSQVISGLLLTLPFLHGDSVLRVENPVSRPYIDMTLDILQQSGINVHHADYELFIINGGQKSKANFLEVEGDWSSAAFFLAAAAIGGEIEVRGLNPDSVQPDKVICDILNVAGADVETEKNTVRVAKKSLHAFEYDITDCPDLFPVLAALAVHCEGETVITGIDRLRYKESSRAEIIRNEFGKIGIECLLEPDKAVFRKSHISEGKIHAHGDHRVAMSCSLLGISADHHISIENAESVYKSYPDFFRDFQKITRNKVTE